MYCKKQKKTQTVKDGGKNLSLCTKRDKLDDINNEPNWQNKVLTKILNTIAEIKQENQKKNKMATVTGFLMVVIMAIGHE